MSDNVMEIMAPDFAKIIELSNAKLKYLPQVFNVTGYGAVGNGTADDTSAVQAAIDDAVSKNATLVFFPPGSYKVTTLTNTSTINFVGDNAVFVGYVGTINNLGVVSVTKKNTITPVYNVQGYGAIGNGTTDDSPAIQSLFATISDGSTIYLPSGDFLINSMLVLTKNRITITGPGRLKIGSAMTAALKIVGDDNVIDGVSVINPADYAAGAKGGIYVNGNRNIVTNCHVDNTIEGILCEQGFTGFQAIGNVVTNVKGQGSESLGDGIVSFSPYSSIVGNYVTCKTGTDGRCGIVLDLAALYSTVSGNTVHGPFRRAIHVEISPYSTVAGNTCKGSTQWGIYIHDNNVAVQGNTVSGPSATPGPMGTILVGIYLFTAISCIVEGNTIYSGGVGNGINVSAGSKNIVSNNQINGAASSLQYGIFMDSTPETTVSGNKVASGVCTSHGIYGYGSAETQILGNSVTKAGGNGISLSTSCNNSIISGNKVKNNSTNGIYVESCNYVLITNNRVFDDQGTKTQQYGVNTFACTYTLCNGNILSGNGTSPTGGLAGTGEVVTNNITA